MRNAMERKTERGVLQRLACAGMLLVLLFTAAGCASSETVQSLTETEQVLRDGNYEAALETLSLFAEEEPENARLLKDLGIAQMGLGNYEEAAESFLSSLKNSGILPSEEAFDTNYYLAGCYYKTGRFEDAIAV